MSSIKITKDGTHVERINKCFNKNVDEIKSCVCVSSNILTRPANMEVACYIYKMVYSEYGVTSETLLSLENRLSPNSFIPPSREEYEFLRLNYNKKFNLYPAAIVLARTTRDISRSVKFCIKNNLPFCIRSGAHAFEPASIIQFGLIIDMQEMNKILKISEEEVVAQVGITLGPFVNEISKRKLALPVGTCPTNGLGGFTLGGGFGLLQRKYGMCIDTVKSIKMVDYKGDILIASEKENSDLFFALRGAGGNNFGVVTEIIYKPVYLPKVIAFNIKFTFEKETSVKILDTWQHWSYNIPSNITTELKLHNSKQPIYVNGIIVLEGRDPRCEITEHLAPLLNLNLHSEFYWKVMNTNEMYRYLSEGGYARPFFFNNKGNIFEDFMPKEVLEILVDAASSIDDNNIYSFIELNTMGGKIADVSSNDTAFSYRNAKFWGLYSALWDLETEEKVNNIWMNSLTEKLSKFYPPESPKYVNFLNFDLTREQALTAYYGNNLERLREIKKKYDPHNVFKFQQSIV